MIWLKAAVITLGIGVLILISMVIAALAWPITVLVIIFCLVMVALQKKSPSK